MRDYRRLWGLGKRYAYLYLRHTNFYLYSLYVELKRVAVIAVILQVPHGNTKREVKLHANGTDFAIISVHQFLPYLIADYLPLAKSKITIQM